MEVDMSSEVSHLSPVIDLTQCAIITTANVVNNITPSATVGGECAANYLTKVDGINIHFIKEVKFMLGNVFILCLPNFL